MLLVLLYLAQAFSMEACRLLVQLSEGSPLDLCTACRLARTTANNQAWREVQQTLICFGS